MPKGIYIRTEQHRQKLSQAQRRNPVRSNLGKHTNNGVGMPKGYKQTKPRSQEFRQRARELWKLNPPKQKKFNTRLENAIALALFSRGIKFDRQVPLSKICIADFYIPERNIVIQVDGDYWHMIPERYLKDQRQTRALQSAGFTVFRFWGHEVDASPFECVDRMVLPLARWLPQPQQPVL